MMEHRHALIVDAELTIADGLPRAGHRPAWLEGPRRTVAGDKGYDTRGYVAHARQLGFTTTSPRTRPGSAPPSMGGPPVTPATVSIRIRERIEELFGWIKTIVGGRKLHYLGRTRTGSWFKLTAAVYNLIHITALDARPARAA
jgi:hypothetical protein